MANGATKYPTKKQLDALKKEYDKERVKKDFLDRYNISRPSFLNVLKNKRCSEKIYNGLFN
jgi:hypothetical protein